MITKDFPLRLCERNIRKATIISQDSHKNQYPGPVCNIGFTAPQYFWQMLIKFAAEVPYLSHW